MATFTDEPKSSTIEATQTYNNWEYIYNDVNVNYNGTTGGLWTDQPKEQIYP